MSNTETVTQLLIAWSGGDTTALVNELYLKLVDQRQAKWQNRAHFFAIAAQLMRRILVDHARRQLRSKRGGGVSNLALDDAVVIWRSCYS
ncbi:MAG TPA: ECF-type sigma factor [Pyrinomonadaceae bacterium]|nr:ECF-type sigma factor [Pyrinomonadaceae bacterium]